MSGFALRGGAALAALTLALAPGPARAQWNNMPYSFSGVPSIASGIERPGMSLAYRQAILQQDLLNRRPRAMIRTPSGSLMVADRIDGQAFLREPEPLYRPEARPVGLVNTGAALSMGGFAIGAWTASLGSSGYQPATSAPGRGGSPIDGWIGLLSENGG